MRRVRLERGQILPLVAVALVALIGIGAFSIDVGYAYFAKRQLQAAADAAALAGSQDLPATTTAFATAASYAAANTPASVGTATYSYEAKCTATSIIATGCDPAVNPNNLVVTAKASTNTSFAGIFGIKHFDVSARASACSPCSSTPVDIVVAIDRTGSMCLDTRNRYDCSDMNSAKEGVRTMLTILNPPSAQVGMVAFPPVATTAAGDVCKAPYNSLDDGWNGYDAAGRGYITDALNGNYKDAKGAQNTASSLYLHTKSGDNDDCVQSAGSTSYSEALRQSMAELTAHGRPDVPDFIVFLTDGEANLGSVYTKTGGTFPVGNLDDKRPCQSAEKAADIIKAKGVTIYTIGYAIGSATPFTAGQWGKMDKNNRWQSCTPFVTSGCEHHQGDKDDSDEIESPAITSRQALEDIASTPSLFYEKLVPGQLNTIFAAIATDIGSGSSRLVDDGF